MPRRRSSGDSLCLELTKQAPVVELESGMWPPTSNTELHTSWPSCYTLQLPRIADQPEPQMESGDSAGSSIRPTPDLASLLLQHTGHHNSPSTQEAFNRWETSACAAPMPTGYISAEDSKAGKSGLSPQIVPGSAAPKPPTVPTLRLSMLTRKPSQVYQTSTLSRSLSIQKQALMLDTSELSERGSALHLATGWRGEDRESLAAAGESWGQGQIHGGVFGSNETFSLPHGVGPDSHPAFSVAFDSALTDPVPFKISSPRHQQAALAGTLQKALRNAQRQERVCASDSGVETESQRDARALNEHSKARFKASASLSRAAGATIMTPPVINNNSPFAAHEPPVAWEESYGPNGISISPRVINESTILSTLESRQTQLNSDKSGANTQRNLEILAQRQQPLADQPSGSLRHGRARTARAESAPSAPCVLPQRAGPVAVPGFFAAAGNKISNVVASRFRSASTATPSLMPLTDPRFLEDIALGSQRLLVPTKEADVRHRSAWGSTSTTFHANGGGQPIAEGFERPELNDTALRMARRQALTHDGSVSYWQGGVADRNEGVWSEQRSPTAAQGGEVRLHSFAYATASIVDPRRGALPWPAHAGLDQTLQFPETALSMAQTQTVQQRPRMSGRQGGSQGVVLRSRSSFWVWLAAKRVRRLATCLLPSAKVQARFEFMFEDMLGVSKGG